MRFPRSPEPARLLTLAGLALSSSFAAAQCTSTAWSSQFSTTATGLAGSGLSMCVFDPDGTGPLPPELYVGGYFSSAGGVPGTRGIARWNGQTWASVGGGLAGTQDVRGLGTFDPDGAGPLPPVLVAIGNFTSIGGIPAQRAASWNGTAWTAMGHDLEGIVTPTSLMEYDPDGPGPRPRVLIFGDWSISMGEQYGGVAQWDGTAWSLLPFSFDGLAIAVFDEDGDGPANAALFCGQDGYPGLIRWDGTQTSIVGGGLGRSALHYCCALRVVDEDGPGPGRPVLLAGGYFTTAGGMSAPGIARWNGSEWSTMGSGIGNAQIEDIIAVDYTNGVGAPTIFAIGPGAGGSVVGLMRWHPAGQLWSRAGDFQSSTFSFPHRLAAFASPGESPSVYAAGPLSQVNQMPTSGIARLFCDCPANCDHSTSTPLLTANDFQCFLNNFAAANPYANCDGSSNIPTLTANDFQCFLNQYAAGCP